MTKIKEDAEHCTAVAYYRYSSHRQGEQSIEGQANAARAWAAGKNCIILKEYADRAVSGRTDDRAEFQLMLKELEKIRPKYLILWKVDRMGRNKEEIAYNKYRCKKAGTKVVYVAEDIPSTPEGVILESILEGMAEYYSIQMAQNIRRGQRNAAEKCQFIGGNRMFGYVSGPDKKYVLDPERAPIVREIFTRYANGESQMDIINWLNEQGIRTLRGTVFTPNSIRTLLKNEKYTGVYIFNKGEVRIEGGVPAIIDHETWEKAQAMMRKNQRGPSKRWENADYLLTDKLFCGHCGGPMSGISGTSRSGEKHCYYTCANRHRKSGGNGCKKKNVRKEWIEDLVLRHTQYIISHDDLLESIADKCYEIYMADKQDTSYVETLKSNLKETQAALNNILKAIEAGIFNDTTKARMDELEAQKRQITDAIQQAQIDASLHLTREQILFSLNRFRNLDCSIEENRKTLIDAFINAVFVYDDKVVITYNFSGDNRTITLDEIDTAISDDEPVFVSSALSSTITRGNEHIIVVRNTFAILVKTESD